MAESNEAGGGEKRQLDGERNEAMPVPEASREPHPPPDDDEVEEEEPKLPMSKARCIALVITLAGAAFLNVRDLLVSFSFFSSAFPPSLLVPHPSSVHSHLLPGNPNP